MKYLIVAIIIAGGSIAMPARCQDSPALTSNNRTPLNDVHIADSPLFIMNENLISGELKITFNLDMGSVVKVHILDMIGKEVKSFTTEMLDSGKYTQVYSVSELPSGLYLVTVESQQSADTRKIIIQ